MEALIAFTDWHEIMCEKQRARHSEIHHQAQRRRLSRVQTGFVNIVRALTADAISLFILFNIFTIFQILARRQYRSPFLLPLPPHSRHHSSDVDRWQGISLHAFCRYLSQFQVCYLKQHGYQKRCNWKVQQKLKGFHIKVNFTTFRLEFVSCYPSIKLKKWFSSSNTFEGQ